VEIEPSTRLRRSARRLLRVHPLRPADALQLAAALTAAEAHAGSLPFVTLDRRLADAARREGFPVLEPA
jgi:predicted nucleic acid-binding protein